MWYGFGIDEQDLEQKSHEHFSYRRVIALFLPYRLPVLGMLLCVLVTSVLGIIPAYLIAQIVDRGIGKHDVPALIGLTSLSLATAVLMGVIGILQTYLSNRVSQQVMTHLRERIYRHLLTLSLRFFSTWKLGDLMSRFTNDIGGVQMIVNTIFISVFSSTITVLVTLSFMFAYNWVLTLVAIAILPAFVLPTQRVGKKSRALSRQAQEAWAELTTTLEETLDISGVLLIKNFNRQSREAERFTKTSRKLVALNMRQALIGRWFFLFIGLLGTLGPAMIYLVGGLQAAGKLPGTISLGEIIAFVALLGRLYMPASQFASIWVSLQATTSLLDRLFALLDEQPEVLDAPLAQPLPSIVGAITFEQVSFAYAEQGFALHSLSFNVRPGQLVALVGPSGAGKTTLTYLISRFYDVTSGVVRIDGHDVRSVAQTSLAAQIGMVTQETYLFHASIRENIAYGRPDASEEEIIAAAKAAAIHEMITSLPEKYATLVGERGYRLSGGEKQRIAIARVILKNPRILILDEATSSLDSQSEALIQAALVPLMQQRTTVVIAHRLSTVLAADMILVLDRGQLVECGTHRELVTRGGLYSQLYHQQFSAQAADLQAKETLLANPGTG
jgi:ATP-binding cassette subfamily B protein